MNENELEWSEIRTLCCRNSVCFTVKRCFLLC